jgi:hypothetical protein
VIRTMYPIIKQRFDPELREILPIEPMFRSDLESLPLQAADLIAWLLRNAWNGRRTEWEWIANELMPVIPMSEWSTIYTPDRLQNVRNLEARVQFTHEERAEIRRVSQLLKR